MSRVVVGTVYGFDFYDANDENVKEIYFNTGEEAVSFYDRLDEENLWPEGAVRVSALWEAQLTRPAYYGIDYGPGSLKHRFGGGYVPRSTYQFNGE